MTPEAWIALVGTVITLLSLTAVATAYVTRKRGQSASEPERLAQETLQLLRETEKHRWPAVLEALRETHATLRDIDKSLIEVSKLLGRLEGLLKAQKISDG